MVGVSLKRVTKRFGEVVAVDDVSLDIASGELFFLLGPSGCGKTTLLRSVAGFCAPDAGEIWFDDRRIDRVPPHKRNTAMVFQNYALWPHMTVEENVAYGLKARGVRGVECAERVARALATVHMEEMAKRRPAELSGGQQQRVAVARALVIEPSVVLLDEPLSNLDAKLRIEMRREIRRIHAETGITMIYVTHDQKEALSMAQRIAVMRDGKVEQIGTPREVYAAPKSRFVAEFVGEVNLLDGVVTDARDGIVSIRTSLGRLTCRGEATTGATVLCGVRPEAIRFVSDDKPDGPNTFAVRIVISTFLGETEQLQLKSKGELVLRATRLHRGGPSPTDTARVTIDPTAVILLPVGS